MTSPASSTDTLIEAETIPITTHNLEALISQITLHHPSSIDSANSTSPGHHNSDQKTEDEHTNDKEGDFDDEVSSASTFSSPIWTPLEVFDFSKHDQVIADISTHLQTYEAMALDLGLEYSYAVAVLEQEDMREDGVDQYDGVVMFDLQKHEEGDDDDMAMLVAREVRYWQAQMDHGMSYCFSCLVSSQRMRACFDLIA